MLVIPGERLTVVFVFLQIWGMEMIYRDFTLPMLAIKNFVVETPDGRQKPKKWSKVTFEIKAFDYTEYCNTNFKLDT